VDDYSFLQVLRTVTCTLHKSLRHQAEVTVPNFIDLPHVGQYLVTMSQKNKLTREEKTITVMVRIFCQAHHAASKGKLCSDCAEMLDYAKQRLSNCPFGPEKGPCSKCTIHCYKPDMRQHIREIMRFSGPKMLTKHPVLAINHLLKNKPSIKKRK
jgi:hypothetical protein